MAFSIAHWNTEIIVLCFCMQRGYIMSILMASVMCLHFSIQEKDILEHTNAKCHSCTL